MGLVNILYSSLRIEEKLNYNIIHIMNLLSFNRKYHGLTNVKIISYLNFLTIIKHSFKILILREVY